MNEKEITTGTQLKEEVENSSATIAYFSREGCNICKVLKPKLKEYLKDRFSRFVFLFVDVEKIPDVAAQNNVFAVPTIIFYFEGKESLRKSRNLNFDQLGEELQRKYSLLFESE